MAEFRTDGGGVLCEDLVRKVFEYDGHAEEARAACIAKGWGDVRRGPPWMIEAGVAKTTCVTISDDNSMLAVCNNFAYTYGLGGYRDGPPYDKHETVVYDVSSGEIRFKLSSSYFITAAAFSPDSKAVVIGTDSDLNDLNFFSTDAGTLFVYNIATDSSTDLRWGYTFPEGVKPGISIVQFSPSGSLVFVGDAEGSCTLHDAVSGRLVRRLQREFSHPQGYGSFYITMACFATDAMLAVGDGNSKLTLFDTTTGLQRWEKTSFSPSDRLTTHSSSWGYTDSYVTCAAFSQDRVTLVVGSSSNSKVKLFDVATGELHTEMNLGLDYQVLAATCSHESFLFTTVAAPSTIGSLYSMIPGNRPGNRPGITSFSTNGNFRLSERSELDVYGLESFGPVLTYQVAFSRDASIMVILPFIDNTAAMEIDLNPGRCKKLALYDVATGKLRLKKRPPGRGWRARGVGRVNS